MMTTKPTDLQTVTLKHMSSDAHDCKLQWEADFAKMEIVLFAPLISTVLLLDFLIMLTKTDPRFIKAGITTAVQASSRFNIRFCVMEVWYALRVYELQTGSDTLDRLAIELIPWEMK